MNRLAFIPGLLTACLCLPISVGVAMDDDQDIEKAGRKIEINLDADILVFTEPVREDGTIDYLAALNKRFRNGVTKDNNAFRALFMLFPPEARDGYGWENAGHLSAVKAALRVSDEEIAAEPKFVSWFDYALREGLGHEQLSDTYAEYWDGPYDAPEARLYVEWLKHVEPALLRAMEAVEKSAYWSPMLGGDDHAEFNFVVQFPHVGRHRALADGMLAWAFYKALNEEPEVVAKAVLALQRLATHQAREPFLLSLLTAIGIDTKRWVLVKELIQKQALPEPELQRLDELFRDKPSFDSAMADILAIGEKSLNMYYYQQLLVGGIGPDDMLGEAEPLIELFSGERIDLERGLRVLSANFERPIKIAQIPSLLKRQRAFESYEEALEKQAEAIQTRKPSNKAEHTEFVTSLHFQAPAAAYATGIQLSSLAKERMAHTAIAVERFRLVTGELPDSLKQLVPRYLKSVPVDPYDKASIHFIRKEGGFKLYSVGPNQEDDKGKDHRHAGDLVFDISYETD